MGKDNTNSIFHLNVILHLSEINEKPFLETYISN